MTDLSALKELAKKAVPGPWMTGTSDDHWRREVRDASGRGVAWCGSNPATKAHANAAYIAACPPEVILQLCEVVEKAPALIAAMAECQEIARRWEPDDSSGKERQWLVRGKDAAKALRSALADLEETNATKL